MNIDPNHTTIVGKWSLDEAPPQALANALGERNIYFANVLAHSLAQLEANIMVAREMLGSIGLTHIDKPRPPVAGKGNNGDGN